MALKSIMKTAFSVISLILIAPFCFASPIDDSNKEMGMFSIDDILDVDINENLNYSSITPVILGAPTGIVTYTLQGVDADDFTIDESTGVVSMVSRDFENPQDANLDNVYHVTILATDEDMDFNTEDWTVTIINIDDSDFVTTWETTTANESITIPINPSYTYNYIVDWGDGSTEETFTGNANHTYISAGTYTLEVRGIFPAIYFNNAGDKDKILTIEQWGDIEWSDMNSAFYGCTNLTVNATDGPDLSNVTSMNNMFKEATSFDSSIGHWDVGNIVTMTQVFEGASLFNQDISSWDVSKVTNMNAMFKSASAFNRPLNDWVVTKVTDMVSMFESATAFDQPLDEWETTSLENVNLMFASASSFDQDLGGWDVSNVKFMYAMFNGATSFNQDIKGWDVSNVISMTQMFFGATNFDQYLGSWTLNSGVFMLSMLEGAGLSCESYSSTIIGWQYNNSTVTGINLGAFGIEYGINAVNAHNELTTTQGWNINGDISIGGECLLFEINIITDTNVDENTIYTSVTPLTTGSFAGTLVWTLSGDDASDFTIDSNTGVVSMVARDYENAQDTNTDNVYELTITATDSDSNTDSEDWTVTVVNVIENVSFAIDAIGDANVNENSAYISVTPSLSGGTPIGTVTYTLGGTDAADFTITSATGVVEMVARDYENAQDANTDNVYELTITVTDSEGNADTEDWTVTVADVAETVAFTIDVIGDANVNENSAYISVTPSLSGGTPIGTVTYTLGGTDAADFTITSATGVVEMVARDYENAQDDDTDNVYELTIIATDSDGNTDTEDWTVTVVNVVETVSFAIDAIGDANVNENSAYISVTPSLSGDTPIGTVTYTLGGTDAADFTITSATGVVEMVARDYENAQDDDTDNVYELTITATDSEGNTDTEDWTVTVSDVIETISFLTASSSGVESQNSVTLDVVLSVVNILDVSVDYVVSGTATNGSDYSLTSATLTIPVGNMTGVINISSIIDDALVEVDETVIVTLSSPTNASLGTNVQYTYSILDNDVAEFSLSKNTASTSEDGTNDSFTVALTAQPLNDVVVLINSGDIGEGTLSVNNLIFTSTNWDVAQTVEITGVDDNLIDGTQSYNVTISVDDAQSDDLYDEVADQTIVVENSDNDELGVNVSAISGNTTEIGGTATFVVTLSVQPSSDVTIALSSGDTSEGTVPSSVTIPMIDWNTGVTVTVTGVDDDLIDGDESYTIITGDVSSLDLAFDALDADDVADVTVINEDSEAGLFLLAEIGNDEVEENVAYESEALTVETGTAEGALVYTISGGADATLFSIDNITGVVSMIARDFESPEDLDLDNVYEVQVTATDEADVTATLSWTVTVIDVEESTELIIPTAFTPNGDGENDMWEILNISEDATVIIFNRDGTILFETKDYSTPWAGNYRRKALPAGPYFYKIINENKEYSGYLTILKK